METALVIKGVFNLSLRALEGFTHSVFKLANVPLTSPNYSALASELKPLISTTEHRVETQYHMSSLIQQASKSTVKESGKYERTVRENTASAPCGGCQ